MKNHPVTHRDCLIRDKRENNLSLKEIAVNAVKILTFVNVTKSLDLCIATSIQNKIHINDHQRRI
jgi:hypothetical protein